MLELTIKKGKKRISFLQQLVKFTRLYINKKSIAYDVVFTKSCLYDSGKIEGINKLFGLTFGLLNVHATSARFGWQPKKNNNIEITAYFYDQEGRKDIVICEVAPDELCKMKLEVKSDEYVFTCNNSKLVVKHGKISKLSYLNFIYFGGVNTAPHDITIKVEKK